MIIHMEIETTYEYLQRIERHLEAWEELLSRVEATHRRLHGAWEAPNAFSFLDELDGAVRHGRSGLMAARENHARAQNEHRQWVAAMEHYEFRPGFVRIAEWLHPLAEKGQTIKDYVEGGSAVGMGILVLMKKASYGAEEMKAWRSGWISHLLPASEEMTGETFFDDMNMVKWGGGLNMLVELSEEIPENWSQYHGDPVKFVVSTAAETAAGMVASAAISAGGAAVGSVIGGAIGGLIGGIIGGPVGGPVGAAIGAHVGEAFGSIAAHWAAEHVKIGKLSVDEWLEKGGDVLGQEAVNLVEEDAQMIGAGVKAVHEGVDAVVKLFSLVRR